MIGAGDVLSKARKRIFIDCSMIDFSRQPTGIPRVVLNYIEVGYRWGVEKGVPVIPVVPTREGLVICRPLPGAEPPPSLLARVEESNKSHTVPPAAQVADDLGHYLARIATAVLNVGAAILPFDGVRRLVKVVDGWLDMAAGTMLRRLHNRANDVIRIKPRAGDIVFCPAYWHDVDPQLYRQLKTDGAKVVTLVHDILPIVFEKFYNSPWRYEFRDRVLQTTTYADALFCVSNYTRDTLVEFLTRNKRPLPPMLTAYNGFEPLVTDDGLRLIREGKALPHLATRGVTDLIRERRPYMMVGSVEPKKGHIPTIHCFETMWSAGLGRDLVIIGRKGWMDREITETIEKSVYYGQRLHWFSNLDDFDLADAYLHAHALVFSSVAEGFGLPLVEAAFYGRPAVVYDTPIAREVIGEAGLFFSDAAGLVERVAALETDEGYAAAAARTAAFHWPSWQDYTPAIFDALLAVLDAKPKPSAANEARLSEPSPSEPEPRHLPAAAARMRLAN